MRCSRFAAALLTALLLSGAARAFDPRVTDILNLRLGMDEATILARLHAQGIDNVSIGRDRIPESAEMVIAAPTLDGRLTIVAAPDGVRSIVYRIFRRGAGNPDMVRSSVLARYGPPSSQVPLAWCDRPGSGGRCPGNRPVLIFEQRPDGECVLSLTGSPN